LDETGLERGRTAELLPSLKCKKRCSKVTWKEAALRKVRENVRVVYQATDDITVNVKDLEKGAIFGTIDDEMQVWSIYP